MAHDLIIRGGTVIDGTGAEGRAADVAVDGERVTAIGDLGEAEAVTEIDAAGLKVTPGFVDLHTHLDAARLRAIGYLEMLEDPQASPTSARAAVKVRRRTARAGQIRPSYQ
ncbi:MAG: amidohydrolase family protein [bacterium]